MPIQFLKSSNIHNLTPFSFLRALVDKNLMVYITKKMIFCSKMLPLFSNPLTCMAILSQLCYTFGCQCKVTVTVHIRKSSRIVAFAKLFFTELIQVSSHLDMPPIGHKKGETNLPPSFYNE